MPNNRPPYINAYLAVVIVILLIFSFYFLAENRRLNKELDYYQKNSELIKIKFPEVADSCVQETEIVHLSDGKVAIFGKSEFRSDKEYKAYLDSIFSRKETTYVNYPVHSVSYPKNATTTYYDVHRDSLDSLDYEDEDTVDIDTEEREYDD